MLCSFSVLTLNRWILAVFTFIYREAVTLRCFWRMVFYEYLDSYQEYIHAKFPPGYSSVNMLRTCSRTPFLVKAPGELLLYIAFNREIINVGVRCKKVKNCLKYILILLILFLTLGDFRWWPKTSWWLLIKHKRGFICASLVPELQSQVFFSLDHLLLCKTSSISEGRIPFGIWILLFLLDSDSTIPLAFWKDVFLSEFGFCYSFWIQIRRSL